MSSLPRCLAGTGRDGGVIGRSPWPLRELGACIPAAATGLPTPRVAAGSCHGGFAPTGPGRSRDVQPPPGALSPAMEEGCKRLQRAKRTRGSRNAPSTKVPPSVEPRRPRKAENTGSVLGSRQPTLAFYFMVIKRRAKVNFFVHLLSATGLFAKNTRNWRASSISAVERTEPQGDLVPVDRRVPDSACDTAAARSHIEGPQLGGTLRGGRRPIPFSTGASRYTFLYFFST